MCNAIGHCCVGVCQIVFDILLIVFVILPVVLIVFIFGWPFLLLFFILWLLLALIMLPCTLCCGVEPVRFEPHARYRTFIAEPLDGVWMWHANTRQCGRGADAEPRDQHAAAEPGRKANDHAEA
jgi:hypothetical protein